MNLKLLVYLSYIILGSIFIGLIIYSTVIGFIISKSEINSENILTYKIDNQGEYFNYNYSKKNIFEKQEIDLNLKSTSDVIKYEISISSPSLIPIYDANFPYDVMTERGTAFFNLDEFPPEILTLSFSASNKYTIQIKIIAYIQENQNEIIKTEKLILINGQN